MPVKPRPEIKDVKIAVHGGPNYAEMEEKDINPRMLLDFSVSSNPCGTVPHLKARLARVNATRYPDSEAIDLRRKIADINRVDMDNVIAGNGSAEIIWLIALAYIKRGDRVLIIEPTFGEYEVAARIMGAKLVSYRVKEENEFRPDIEEIKRLINHEKPQVVFICNPNNPTGQFLYRDEIVSLISARPSTLFVVDEAYVAFVSQASNSAALVNHENVVFLRSMTKDYSLAGLRLGYALASKEIIQNLRKVRPPWNVNSFAQAAGVLSLEDKDFVPSCTAKVLRARDFLIRSFESLGFTCVPSKANFFLVKVGQASKMREALLEKGILVRDCASFGLPEHIRIAALDMSDCRKLVAAMRAVKEQIS